MFSFTIKDFMSVLESYNLALWPMQIFGYILVIVALFFTFKSTKYSQQIVLGLLSFLWLFTGIGFGLLYWAPSHLFGYVFGVCCIIQGLIFLYGLMKSDITISFPGLTNYSWIGIIFILYAMVGYQVFGIFLGHTYPRFFPVGLVPCPTTIFTFGIFLIMSKRIPIKYLVIPFILALGGFLAAYKGIYEDIGLIIAGLLGTFLIMRREKQDSRGETPTT